MKAKLAPPFTDLLSTRIYISRHTKLFSLEQVANNWGMSARTLFRYDSPHDREVSRMVARNATERAKAIDRSLCQACGTSLRTHTRCPSCTILTHGRSECGCNRCIDIVDYSKLIVHIIN